MIGAGGASRAIIYGLLKENIEKIYLSNRTLQKAKAVLEDFGKHFKVVGEIIFPISLDDIDDVVDDVDIIVNTTSVGLKDDDKALFDYNRIDKKHIVVDIIYRETQLLKHAKK